MKKINYKQMIFMGMLLFFLISCGSLKPEYDASVAVERYFRYAQDARNAKKYKLAHAYYDIIIENFSQHPDKVVSAQYEKGALYYRTKEYKKALQMFTIVVQTLNNPATASAVSPAVAYLVRDLGQKTQSIVQKDADKNDGGD